MLFHMESIVMLFPTPYSALSLNEYIQLRYIINLVADFGTVEVSSSKFRLLMAFFVHCPISYVNRIVFINFLATTLHHFQFNNRVF